MRKMSDVGKGSGEGEVLRSVKCRFLSMADLIGCPCYSEILDKVFEGIA